MPTGEDGELYSHKTFRLASCAGRSLRGPARRHARECVGTDPRPPAPGGADLLPPAAERRYYCSPTPTCPCRPWPRPLCAGMCAGCPPRSRHRHRVCVQMNMRARLRRRDLDWISRKARYAMPTPLFVRSHFLPFPLRPIPTRPFVTKARQRPRSRSAMIAIARCRPALHAKARRRRLAHSGTRASPAAHSLRLCVRRRLALGGSSCSRV